MKISEALLPEFDQEMANTRKTLERVPDNKLDWKPHPKSMTFAQLATHVAQLAQWGGMPMEPETLDIAPGGVPLPSPPPAASNQELLQMFDANVVKCRAAIAAA